MALLILIDLAYFRALNMHYLALGALLAWITFFPATATAEAVPSLQRSQQTAGLSIEPSAPNSVEQPVKRQINATSTCKAYGVDFQDGGSYFIDQRSIQPFQAVTQFEDCQVGDADVLLVDRQTAQQYNCGKIPTTPGGVPQMATCEIRELDMRSGDWSLLVLGDNALQGKPFAYQRDFVLSVAPQLTFTVSKTCVYTFTERPTRTMTSTSTIAVTNILPNTLTLTRPAATNIITITPKPSTFEATTTTTRTFTTWTRTENRETVVVTPTCRVPPKPMLADGTCKIVPTVVPVPKGVEIASSAATEERAADREMDVQAVRKRSENLSAASSRIAASTAAAPPVTAGDPATVTLTARIPVNLTTTTTLPAKTIQINSTTTHTIVSTAPPKTVLLGTAMYTTRAPAKTVTVWENAFTRVYEAQTMSVGWTWTSTGVAGAEATEICRRMGGRMG